MTKSIRTSAARRTVLALVMAAGLAAVAPSAMAAAGFSSTGVHMVGLGGATPLVAQAMSFGVQGAIVTGTSQSKPELSELSVTRTSDANTPELLRLATTGKALATLSFSIVVNKGGVLTETQRFTLTNARVQGIAFGAESSGKATESVSFSFDAIKMENVGATTVLPWTYSVLTNVTK